jgi:hypothetical protein
MNFAAAGDVVGKQRGRADQQRVRIGFALSDIRESDAAAPAGLVHNREAHRHELVLGENALDGARGLVVTAARGRAHHDLDVLLRRPALRRNGACGERQQGADSDASDAHETSSFVL